MQKNELLSNILPHCQTPDPERRETILNEPQVLKTSSEAKSSPGVNRDSGIFEDLFSVHLKDNISLDRNSPTQDYFSYDQSPNHSCGAADEEYSLKSKCNSDRVLHASISSLNTEIDLLPSLSSLSSFSSSEEEEDSEEEDEEEEEIVEERKEEEDNIKEDTSDDEEEELELNNDDISVSSDSENSSDSESSSFGYHSLLNDATPEENSHFSSDFSKLSEDAESDEESLHDDNSKASLNSCSEFQEYETSSLNFLDTKNLSISTEILKNQGEESSDNNLNKEYSLSSLSLSVSTSSCSSEDESPSDIENKMAETEIKMNDSLLSNGREELSIHNRKMKHYLKTKDLKIALGEIPSHRAYMKEKVFLKNNVHLNNNNNNNYKHINSQIKIAEKQRIRPPNSLPLQKNKVIEGDNRTNSADSPIIDAYEKECQDAPEKSVKESENKITSKTMEKEDVAEKRHNGVEEPDEAEMKAFETAMKQAIRRKEADSLSFSRINITFDDVEMRHRPSPQQRRRERNALRRSLQQTSAREKNKQKSPDVGEFDVYTMETALPKIDWDAIEAHLEATREEERRRRTDREEIRKKLAMGTDEEAFNDASIKKPSLQSRLQNGKNLQICFMNETASDCESQCSDTESTQDRIDEIEGNLGFKDTSKMTESECQTMDFMAQQAKLQAEARLALSQAKEMARMQMEIEKQNQRKSPITEIIKDSFNKIGFPFPAGKRRMSRQLLTDMNVAQLQVIVNDLHTQIENLNEDLVQLLLTRDDLHMEQDSMLVDIEDLTKHLGAKQRPNATLCTSSTNYAIGSNSTTNNLRFSASIIPSKSLKLRPTIVKK
ncbi:UNVERIFIED_CONTAM: hypothetical protein RMT77_000489 [Armadillidium vulgare]